MHLAQWPEENMSSTQDGDRRYCQSTLQYDILDEPFVMFMNSTSVRLHDRDV